MTPYLSARLHGHVTLSDQLAQAGAQTGLRDTVWFRSAEDWTEIGQSERSKCNIII